MTGTETFNGGGPIPDQGPETFTVSPASPGGQHTQDLYGDVKDFWYETRADGIYATRFKISSPMGFNADLPAPSGVLALKIPSTSGDTWSWTVSSLDHATTLSVRYTVVGPDVVYVQGEPEQTVVVKSHIELTGALAMNDDQTLWEIPTSSMVVRRLDRASGTTPIVFTTDTDSRIRALKPS